MSFENEIKKTPAPGADRCQAPDCENEPTIDDYGVCDKHLTPEIEAYLRREQNRDGARL